jgi:hypothetical protein
MSHQERVSAQEAAFNAAMRTFEERIGSLDDQTAMRPPADGGWTPAQIAWHVGQTNELLAAVISGAVPTATPAPEGFVENPAIFAGIPDKVQTFPQLVPPDGVTRAEGLSKLKGSTRTYQASLQGLTPERASGHCVDLPFGKLSLYQIADFAAAHVTRHLNQLQRTTVGV